MKAFCAALGFALSLVYGASLPAMAACYGTPIPAPPAAGALILPPVVPQPSAQGDIVGVVVQNREGNPPGNNYVWGQPFKKGDLLPTDGLRINYAAYGGAILPQIDVVSKWSDGSIRFALLTTPLNLCTGTQDSGMIQKKVADTATPVAMVVPTPFTLVLTFTSGGYTGTKTVDLGAAVTAALAGTPDYWQRGRYRTQLRVEVPVTGASPNTLRIVADLTMEREASNPVTAWSADVQIDNDLTTVVTNGQGPALPPLAYSATLRLDTATKTFSVPQHYQYQDLHVQISNHGMPNYVADASGPAANVLHDLKYFEYSAATLPYDRTTGITNGSSAGPNANIFDMIHGLVASPGFATLLSANSVEPDMPVVGGRPDIGYTTEYNTAWLMTGDQGAANVGLAWGDTGGAVTWNFRNLATNRWLTPADNPGVWIDPRSQITIANALNGNSGWNPEQAHQPNLAYVPYIMTGLRWYLDRLNAQAAFSMVALAPDAQYGRCIISTCDLILHPASQQVRGMAWSMREIGEAARFGKDGEMHQVYFSNVLAHNWTDMASQETYYGSIEGEPTGWWQRVYDAGGVHGPWEQDYLTGVWALLAGFGDVPPKTHIGWQLPWLRGRFNPAITGWNPHDGCNYGLVMFGPAGINDTWAKVESATAAIGYSNGSGWTWSSGDFGPIARAALGASLSIYPGDSGLTAALSWLNGSGAPNVASPTYFLNDPTFNIVPRQ